MPRGGDLGKAHSLLVHEARLEVGNYPDVRLWPNQQGIAAFESGAKVRYGLKEGSADLIGILAPSGRFISLEAKTGDAVQTEKQKLWMELIRSYGGFACVFHSMDEVRAAIERARRGENS